MKAFLASCWRRRWLRRVIWTLITLVTLLVLFYQGANWAGAHRWRAAQARFAREGESLDIHQFAADLVPDAQNFCAIPLLKDLPLAKDIPDAQKAEGVDANLRKLRSLDATRAKNGSFVRGMTLANVALGTPADLKTVVDLLRKKSALPLPPDSGDPARDLLSGLTVHDAVVSDLAAGLDRTGAQWTPSWRTRELPATIYEIPVPHYGVAAGLCQYLALRATAAAQTGDAPKAHESLLILLHLSRASSEDPWILASLVAASQYGLACNVIWECSRAHCGTVEDFRRLELELRRLDFRAALLRGFRFEAAGGADAIQWLKHSTDARRQAFFDLFSFTDEERTHKADLGFLTHLLPAGWYDMNAAAMLELYHDFAVAPLRDQGFPGCLQLQPELEQRLKSEQSHKLLHLDSILARLALSSTSKICPRIAYNQDMVNQAIIACALERYHAAHQSYPEALGEFDLEGRPMPLDLISGKLPGYRRTPDGRYMLWSVGLDRKDDGGKRMLHEDAAKKVRFYDPAYHGDWVWDFPQ